MRKTLYWPDMAKDVYPIVLGCRSCAMNCTRGRKNMFKLFFRKDRLKYNDMDQTEPQPRTKHSNQFVVLITDSYTKRAKTIVISKTNVTTRFLIFIEHWVVSYGILSEVPAEYSPQFVLKLIMVVCRTLYDILACRTNSHRHQ